MLRLVIADDESIEACIFAGLSYNLRRHAGLLILLQLYMPVLLWSEADLPDHKKAKAGGQDSDHDRPDELQRILSQESRGDFLRARRRCAASTAPGKDRALDHALLIGGRIIYRSKAGRCGNGPRACAGLCCSCCKQNMGYRSGICGGCRGCQRRCRRHRGLRGGRGGGGLRGCCGGRGGDWRCGGGRGLGRHVRGAVFVLRALRCSDAHFTLLHVKNNVLVHHPDGSEHGVRGRAVVFKTIAVSLRGALPVEIGFGDPFRLYAVEENRDVRELTGAI
mmetsp:Transcript_43710/g.102001  ORF Transcript_43710/g.102001 Transcript_43710/m.102001 type:complete len:278 (-) Transcript_43710:972-1805(-)